MITRSKSDPGGFRVKENPKMGVFVDLQRFLAGGEVNWIERNYFCFAVLEPKQASWILQTTSRDFATNKHVHLRLQK